MPTVCRRPDRGRGYAPGSLRRVFTNIGQYRFEGSLEGWVRRIVVHSALEVLRKRLVRFTDIDGEVETLSSTDTDIVEALSAGELMRLICDLPDGYRVVFNLYVIEGYDHNEIAALAGISAATSRSQLLKARRALQEQIKHCQTPPNTLCIVTKINMTNCSVSGCEIFPIPSVMIFGPAYPWRRRSAGIHVPDSLETILPPTFTQKLSLLNLISRSIERPLRCRGPGHNPRHNPLYPSV